MGARSTSIVRAGGRARYPPGEPSTEAPLQTSATSPDTLLALPLDELIFSGGDHRQLLDPSTGLSDYRVRGAPRPGVPFGSCTASWPSELAWQAATSVLDRWRGAPSAPEAIAATADDVRARLSAAFDLDPDAAVVLSPSGTDAVFVVSALALARGAERVHHIVVGAGELGSGTLGAAAGDAFTPDPPVGTGDELDIGLSGLSDRCTAQPVYLRTDRGELLQPELVDASVAAATEAAIAAGSTVVVHMVAHSKTGLRAPSVGQLDALVERHPEQVVVLMDAAQGRVAPVDIRRALAKGYVVLFTGSKFYSGPPFSGALFLPPERSADPGPLPEGLNEWLTTADLPDTWPEARSGLTVECNPGLMLRWSAAVAEIEAYHAITPDRRSRVYHTFAASLMSTFGPSESIDLIVPVPPVHELASGLGAFPSVFSITVRGPRGLLGLDELRRLHTELDTPIEGDDPALAQRFHLGQPVALGPPQDDPAAVLRIALGARLVRELADLPDSGAAWFAEHVTALCRKIEALVLAPHPPA